MRYTIDKAKNQNVAAATVFRQSHIGRLASYPLMAAREGMIAMITADSGRSAKAVAPFGGAKARLGHQPDLFRRAVEFGRSVVLRHGDIRRRGRQDQRRDGARRAGAGGWLIDAEGKPSTDPRVLRSGGALLPLGGTEGYKGTAWLRSWKSCRGC